MFKRRFKNKKGFTLIELAIANSILAVIFGGITIFGVQTIQSFDRSQAIKNTIENTSYVIEKLNKTIRTSHTINGEGSEIFIIDNNTKESYCYFFDDDSKELKMRTGDENARSCDNLSSNSASVMVGESEVEISGSFKIKETNRDDSKRGLVRTNIVIKYLADEDQNEDEINIQSSVSLRDYGLDLYLCDENTTVEDSDGNSYPVVKIGTQCWMAENLDVGNEIDGSENQTDDGNIEKYCYDDESSKCDDYGGLYQWDEAMQYSVAEGARGICPEDWHIPTDVEWHILENYLTDEGETCDSTRSSAWDCDPAGTALTEGGSSDFEAVLAGFRGVGWFSSENQGAFFWSSSVGSLPFLRYWGFSSSEVYRTGGADSWGFSIRCIKD